MEAVKIWAKSIFLLALFSSTVLLIIPKSMQKQSRFVAEMLLLLCVVAPLGGLLHAGAQETVARQDGLSSGNEATSLGRFYSDETARRVLEIGKAVGFEVASVDVSIDDSGFSLQSVAVHVESEPGDELLTAFTESVTAYLGIGNDKLQVVVDK